MISVILPIYKEKIEWIKLSIDSILNQTYRDFELLLINDNPESQENINLIKEYEKSDNRVIGIFHEKNIGLPKTLNQSIKRVKGRYIARMDADDISMPNRFEEQVKCLENDPEIGVVGAYSAVIDETGRISYSMNLYEHDNDLKAQTLFENPFVHPVLMIRKDLILENPYDENCAIWQDRELWCRIKDKTKFYNIPKILIKYRISSFHAPQKAGLKKSEDSRRYCANKIFDHWNLDNQYKETYLKVVSGKKINKVELNSFFKYLLYENHMPENRYFILKQYMKCLTIDHKYGLFFNSIATTFPLTYFKALLHSIKRLVRKYSLNWILHI